MPKYKVKEGHSINLQSGSRKGKDKKIDRYEGGQSVELSDAQALSHADDIELSDKQAEKLAAPEEPKKK
jgi:hypothetical protein